MYGFVDDKTAESELNRLWKQIQLSVDPNLEAEDVWEFESGLDEGISLSEAIRFRKKWGDDTGICIHANPAHAQEARAVIERLRAANESLREFISSEFKPEELI